VAALLPIRPLSKLLGIVNKKGARATLGRLLILCYWSDALVKRGIARPIAAGFILHKDFGYLRMSDWLA
jgi:hypothetical protein